VSRGLFEAIQKRLDSEGRISARELAEAAAEAGSAYAPPSSSRRDSDRRSRPRRNAASRSRAMPTVTAFSESTAASGSSSSASRGVTKWSTAVTARPWASQSTRASLLRCGYWVDADTHAALVREYPFLAANDEEAERAAEEDRLYAAHNAAMGFEFGDAA
jgi:hypothetical protein